MRKFIPYVYVHLFVLLTAFTMVFIHNIGVEIPVELLLVLTTGYAIMFFHALRFKTCLTTYKKLQTQKSSYIGVLISLSMLWIGSFAISVYFSASVYILFATAWSGLLGAMCLGVFEKKQLYIYKTLALAILIIFSYIVLFFSGPLSHLMFGLMVILTSITGIAMFCYFKFSHHLNDVGAPYHKTWTPSLKTLLPQDLLTQPVVEAFYNT